MSSGLPDWSKVKTALAFNYAGDNAELAARLASPFRYYRSGNVIAFSSFEDGDDYFELIAGGATAVCAGSTDKALYGAKSLKMELQSTDLTAQAVKRLPYHSGGVIGLSFAIDLSFLTRQFVAQLIIIRNSLSYTAGLTFNKGTNLITIQNSSGGNTTVETFPTVAAPGNHQWYSAKLFVDSINKKYFAVDLNTTLHDLSTLDLLGGGLAVRDCVVINFLLAVPLAGTDRIYLDNVVYTVNDPN